jgi:hypothetical protein
VIVSVSPLAFIFFLTLSLPEPCATRQHIWMLLSFV